MNAAKQAKPATPLPFRLGLNPGPMIYAADGVQVADCRFENGGDARKDAAYIVQCANEYPRLLAERADLIAALQACIESIEDFEAYDRECTGEFDALPEPTGDQARALLARIGASHE